MHFNLSGSSTALCDLTRFCALLIIFLFYFIRLYLYLIHLVQTAMTFNCSFITLQYSSHNKCTSVAVQLVLHVVVYIASRLKRIGVDVCLYIHKFLYHDKIRVRLHHQCICTEEEHIMITSTNLGHKPIAGILCWLVYFYIVIVGFYSTILLPELLKYSD